MSIKTLIAAATLGTVAIASQPAAAQSVRFTGDTRVSRVLAVDIVTTIARYSKATGTCSFVFSADTRVMPASYVPRAPAPRMGPGGHYERWIVNACARKQMFQIAMWPSPRGGTDFAVTPLTGKLPLHAM